MFRQALFFAASVCFASSASAGPLNLGSLPVVSNLGLGPLPVLGGGLPAFSSPDANGLTALPSLGNVLTGLGVYDAALPLVRTTLGTVTVPLLGAVDGVLVGLGASQALPLVTSTVGAVTDPLLGALGDSGFDGLLP